MKKHAPPTRQKEEPFPITPPRCPECRDGNVERRQQLAMPIDGRQEWYCSTCQFCWSQ